jgi:hypothetical protein
VRQLITMPNYSDIGSVPGAWRSSSIASTASAAISRFGSYNPSTDVRISTGVVRTTNAGDFAALSSRASGLSSQLNSYHSARSSFDAGPRTSAPQRAALVSRASSLRSQVRTYNRDASAFNRTARGY